MVKKISLLLFCLLLVEGSKIVAGNFEKKQSKLFDEKAKLNELTAEHKEIKSKIISCKKMKKVLSSRIKRLKTVDPQVDSQAREKIKAARKTLKRTNHTLSIYRKRIEDIKREHAITLKRVKALNFELGYRYKL